MNSDIQIFFAELPESHHRDRPCLPRSGGALLPAKHASANQPAFANRNTSPPNIWISKNNNAVQGNRSHMSALWHRISDPRCIFLAVQKR